MFLQVSVCPHQGGGVHGFIWRGHAWFYSAGVCVCAWFYSGGMRGFIQGGMRGFIWGACMVLFGGHVWFYSGGVHGFIQVGGHAWFYLGGHAWFYLGGMRGFIRGACVVFSVFSDTMRYGQWAGGTHPTGMHSCMNCFDTIYKICQSILLLFVMRTKFK